jgi:peroxiredoxin
LLAATQSCSAPLKAGDSIPDVKLRTETNQEVSLRKWVAEKPAALIFYRGGWCPFCTKQLSNLVGIEQDLENPRPDTEITSIDSVSTMTG